MAIFLDTGNFDEIKKYHSMGIIRGVTTNPTILTKEGVTGGMEGVKKRSIEIAGLINPLPLSVEVTNNDPQRMLSQALEFSKWAQTVPLIIPKFNIYKPADGKFSFVQVIYREYTGICGIIFMFYILVYANYYLYDIDIIIINFLNTNSP